MGGLWGSFANVCIHRLPKEQNVVSGRSFCPKCKQKIVWYDNIPIVSYIILKGKCRNCDYRIAFQYLIVEILSLLSFIHFIASITVKFSFNKLFFQNNFLFFFIILF